MHFERPTEVQPRAHANGARDCTSEGRLKCISDPIENEMVP